MTVPESWTVNDMTSNPELNPATATILALNTDIDTFTAAKDMTETTPMKATFESAVSILTLVRVRVLVLLPFFTPANQRHDQNEMINDDTLVELAKDCAGTCHVLTGVTQERDLNSLSGPSKRAVEDLRRYANPANSPTPIASDNG